MPSKPKKLTDTARLDGLLRLGLLIWAAEPIKDRRQIDRILREARRAR